jgi:predicted porin
MIFLRTVFMSAMSSLLVFSAQAADLPTNKPTPSPGQARSCFDSLASYIGASAKDCPLTWKGITLYGEIDVGAGYSSHAAGFNSSFPQGVSELIAKYSQGARYQWIPNGLSQSNVGINIKKEFAPEWLFVGDLNLGFDPYSLELANGPKSLVDNNLNTIGNQSANGDSSRAGQWDNSHAYAGLSNSVFGTLTLGRQNTLSDDAVAAYDPMAGSYAFSLIGHSSSYVSGVGETETARYNTSAKYKVAYNNFRAAGVAQFGGYQQGNGSNGAFQVSVGADYSGFSFDAIYSYAKDVVSLSAYGENPLPNGVMSGDLKATLANVSGGVLAGKYNFGPLTVFGGYEYAQFSPPSDAYPNGFQTLGGYTVVPGAVNVKDYISNKILQVGWIGAKYALRADLDVAGAFYYARQNNYAPPGSSSTVCGPNTKAPIPGGAPQGALNSYCSGTLSAVSGMIDWRPVERLDVYAGLLYSQAAGGIASGYIYSNNIAPTAGLRLSF